MNRSRFTVDFRVHLQRRHTLRTFPWYVQKFVANLLCVRVLVSEARAISAVWCRGRCSDASGKWRHLRETRETSGLRDIAPTDTLSFSCLTSLAKSNWGQTKEPWRKSSGPIKDWVRRTWIAKIAPWSSRWFEDISVALIWLTLIWLTLIWLALIWLTLIWLALIWLTLIWLALIWVAFLSKFLLFSLNIHNLGTHLAHIQMQQI